jgi:hypothetical protein
MYGFLGGDAWNFHLANVTPSLKKSPITKFSASEEAVICPSQECANYPFVGLFANVIRRTISSSRQRASNPISSKNTLHRERRILMGHHSEPKSAEEIRNIFREVQVANVARAESSDKASRLNWELHVIKSRNASIRLWIGCYFNETKAAQLSTVGNGARS